MNQLYSFGEQPPMWWLEAAETDIADVDVIRGEDVLRFGKQIAALDDIASFRVVEIVERSKQRLALVIGAIGLSALLTPLAVLFGGPIEQLLAGFVFLFIVGMSAVSELLGLTGRRYFQVTVFTHGARKVRYNSTDSRDVGRLIDFLEDTLGR